MKASLEDIEIWREEYAGYCNDCDDVTSESGVEPDAEDYECPNCGNETMIGIELAVISGRLEIK